MWRDVALGVAAGTAAVAAAPVVLSVVGFTSGGIALGSIAAGTATVFARRAWGRWFTSADNQDN